MEPDTNLLLFTALRLIAYVCVIVALVVAIRQDEYLQAVLFFAALMLIRYLGTIDPPPEV